MAGAYLNGIAVKGNLAYATDAATNQVLILGGNVAAVPEPTGVLGTLIAGGCVLVFRRRLLVKKSSVVDRQFILQIRSKHSG